MLTFYGAGMILGAGIYSILGQAATVALAFTSYLQYFIALPRFAVACVVLVVFTGINIVGIRQSSWTNAVFTVIEALGLVLFIWLGLKQPEFGKALLAIPKLGTVSSAALASTGAFSVRAVCPLILVVVLPSTFLIASVSLGSLLFLALLA